MLNKLAQFYCKTQRPDISKKSLDKGKCTATDDLCYFCTCIWQSSIYLLPPYPFDLGYVGIFGVRHMFMYMIFEKMPFLHCLNYLAFFSYIDPPAVTQLSAAAAAQSAERLWCCQVNEWHLKYLDLYVTHISDFIISNHINW